jgi:diguanylate cyclase (GGDEF)-like protein
MKHEGGNLAIVPTLRAVQPQQARPGGENSVVRMLIDLQTTLDIERILGMFSGHLQDLVPHDGYLFSNEPFDLRLGSGRQGRHSCGYVLKLEAETLGEWRTSRDRRFSEAELERMEILLSHLLYPLRNGLRYREAMCHAQTDPLTQVGNRAALFACLEREVEVARRYESPLAVIFLDIDHFKAVNDTYGHAAGDAVLRSVARLVKDAVRATDGVFRYGGEEFAILIRNSGKTGALQMAERIRRSVAACEHRLGALAYKATASLGVAGLNPGDSASSLLGRADQAMYAAKRGGRNRVEAAA